MRTKTSKVGIVGCGRMGSAHAQAYRRRSGFQLVACVNPTADGLSKFRKKWKIPNGYRSLAALLEKERLDVISLCSPSEFHAAQIHEILASPRRPKLLFVEKPVCLREPEQAPLLRKSEESGVKVVVNHSRRFDPAHRRLREIIRVGTFGRLLQARGLYYGGWLNNGVHLIDTLKMLLPSKDLTLLSSRPARHGRGKDANLDVDLMATDAPVEIRSVDERHYQLFELDFQFERGRVRLLDAGSRVWAEKVRVNAWREKVLVPVAGFPREGLASPLAPAIEGIARILRGEAKVSDFGTDLSSAFETMRILWAAQATAPIPAPAQTWQANLTLGREEEQAAGRVVREGLLSLFEGSAQPDPPFSFWGGPAVQKLEEAWADHYGARYAVSMNSATSGLIAAVGALGIGYGDEVIVSPYTMSAAATAPLIYGAIPIFADVKLETGSLDPASVEQRLTPRTKAVIVVHQFGIPAEMDRVLALAQRHGLKVIEDCAQAHGALYQGRPVGTLGEIGVFSLNVNKTIQSGEGGICLTQDERLRHRLALIRNHAEAVAEGAGVDDLTNLIGFNFRMTEVTAAIAYEQLKKLKRLNASRIELVEFLSRALSGHPFLVPPPACAHAAWGERCPSGCRSTYYLYPLRFLKETVRMERSEFVRILEGQGIPFSEGYVRPLYRLPLFQKKQLFRNGYPFEAPANRPIQTNYIPEAYPNAERLHFQEMLINEYVRPPHTREEMGRIARAVDKLAKSTGSRREVAV